MDRLKVSDQALRIHRWINQTAIPFPAGRSVKELFEDTAQELTGTAAVVDEGGRTITYGELNRMANGLAHMLQQKGLAAGETVGVCMARSAELIAVVLALIKCGAAYLPFDESWPDARLHSMFAAARCAWILSDAPSRAAKRFPRFHVVAVTSPLPEVERDPATSVSGTDIAYINFTSGSTGAPKGVPIRHHSIARLVFGPSYARLDEHSVLLHLAPMTFDAATFEIWGALLNGGSVVLYPSGFVKLSELKRVLEGRGINVLFLTTALFNAVIDESPGALETVDTILTGGEAHSIGHINKALELYGPGRVVSVYGPTECTTFATYYPINEVQPRERALPIGRPIQNTRMYVVRDGTLCEAGETGEIWLAGPGLSPGYLGAPDITGERFTECEIGGERERIYRTGDLAYLLQSGDAVFQGRQDDQVKISGYRIELSEIAYHLDQHPDVKRSFVTVSGNAAGARSLHGFVVARPGCDLDAVLRHLRDRLPDYMIPAGIHVCDSLPLSDNGKVDRGALLSMHRLADGPG